MTLFYVMFACWLGGSFGYGYGAQMSDLVIERLRLHYYLLRPRYFEALHAICEQEYAATQWMFKREVNRVDYVRAYTTYDSSLARKHFRREARRIWADLWDIVRMRKRFLIITSLLFLPIIDLYLATIFVFFAGKILWDYFQSRHAYNPYALLHFDMTLRAFRYTFGNGRAQKMLGLEGRRY